jgi:NTE family protein
MAKKTIKPITLALQGGGAHGAFTWGVLDALLGDERIDIKAISGTSAGAMNAVALAEGMTEGGREGARNQLRRFWGRIGDAGRYSPIQRGLFGKLLGRWNIENTPGYMFMDWMSHVASPYTSNPLDLNPLRDVLQEEIDFAKVRACTGLALYIAATNVHTGRIEVFDQKNLTAAHVLASACLPTMFRAVEIDGTPYWDGGYTGNPALFPLFNVDHGGDLLIVQLNRILRKELPITAQQIENRLNEITFNASLLSELRAIELVQRLLDEGKVEEGHFHRLRLHRIDADKALAKVAPSSKINAAPDFIKWLFKRGKTAAETWLEAHFDDLGERATLDVAGLVQGKAVDGN